MATPEMPHEPPKTRAAEPCDLLAAIFAVNRAAKRWRDAAANHYDATQYGLATHAKRRKENLYRLKDAGIARAYQHGRLAAVVIHRGLCLYQGEGYSYHSTLIPFGIELPIRDDGEPLLIEAKPQGPREPRQSDAIAALENLPVDYSLFDRLPPPARAREPIICWSCGGEGHIARDCWDDDGVDCWDSDDDSSGEDISYAEFCANELADFQWDRERERVALERRLAKAAAPKSINRADGAAVNGAACDHQAADLAA